MFEGALHAKMATVTLTVFSDQVHELDIDVNYFEN